MVTLSKVNVGSIEYIRQVLNGGRTLSQRLFDSLDLSKGEAKATCNRDLAEQVNFDAGGICSANESLQLLSEFINQKLSQNKSTCIFVNDSACKGDEVLGRHSNVLYHDREVYHYVNTGASVDEVKKTIRAAETSANLVGVVASLEVTSNIFSSKELDSSTIQSIVDKSECIIIGAFDGECYLVWTPQSF